VFSGELDTYPPDGDTGEVHRATKNLRRADSFIHTTHVIHRTSTDATTIGVENDVHVHTVRADAHSRRKTG
jgi:hypothetical protein